MNDPLTTAERPRQLTPEALGALYAQLGVQEHPVLPLPTLTQAQAFLATESGRVAFLERLKVRQQRIALALEDPLNWGWEFGPWADADALLSGTWRPGIEPADMLACFGINRGTKTWYAVKRAAQLGALCPESCVLLLRETELISIGTLQKLLWMYLRREIEQYNGKRNVKWKINYTEGGGFTERKLILPNGSVFYFPTYSEEPEKYEGLEFGAKPEVWEAVRVERAKQGLPMPPNIGAVPDESMPLAWLKMFRRRLKFRKAKLVWSFTPVKGVTPAIKELVGAGARTLASVPSELLPGQNLPDCPPGHMPYIRQCSCLRTMAIYFSGQVNPFGPAVGETYYDQIKRDCAGKTREYIERIAYGFARDSIARAFPNFGPRNVVRREQIPHGTNYLFFDPHGTRNWPMLWVRAVPTRPVSLYVYREWPDLATYGEWAVPSEREVNEQQRKGWDGDPGPAQTGLGWGVTQFKLEILRQERIAVPAGLLQEGGGRRSEAELDQVLRVVPDENHRRRIRQALRNGESLEELRETVAARFGDPRGIHNTHVTEMGGTTLFDEFEKEQVDAKTGRVLAPGMELCDAPTSRRANAEEADEGITQVNELLGCVSEQAIAGMSQPALFVCEECRQLIWMFENYTGRSGGTGAAKDFADLIKYICLAELEHVEETRPRGRAGRGW